MNLILLFSDDFVSPNVVRLSDYRATHIREVHRAPVGKTLRVGLAGGATGEGKVIRVEGDAIEIETRIPEGRPTTPALSLVLALPRPQTLKKVLEGIGAVGVRELVLVNTERVQKSFFSSRLLKDDAWMRHLRFGMEQGGKTYLTAVSVHASFAEYFEKAGDALPGDTIRIVTHPATGRTLWDTELARSHPRGRRILCAVGPEGGWIEPEVQQLREKGFQTVSLGNTIHRVENAVMALLAQVELLQTKFAE
jgi:RsmE family RNA methyltransferase